MKEITATELGEFLGVSDIRAADLASTTGREIHFANGADRTVVVYVGDPHPQDYFLSILAMAFALEESWFLVPRHGNTSGIGIIYTPSSATATLIESPDFEEAISFARRHVDDMMRMGDDYYFISKSGKAIISIDHHMFTEGMTISFRGISGAGRLLSALNTAGAEVELFSKTANQAL